MTAQESSGGLHPSFGASPSVLALRTGIEGAKSTDSCSVDDELSELNPRRRSCAAPATCVALSTIQSRCRILEQTSPTVIESQAIVSRRAKDSSIHVYGSPVMYDLDQDLMIHHGTVPPADVSAWLGCNRLSRSWPGSRKDGIRLRSWLTYWANQPSGLRC